MRLIIEGDPKEIATLVVEIQEQLLSEIKYLFRETTGEATTCPEKGYQKIF